MIRIELDGGAVVLTTTWGAWPESEIVDHGSVVLMIPFAELENVIDQLLHLKWVLEQKEEA